MPCEPSSSSSRVITRSIGMRGGSGRRPTCRCRPRLRRPAIDAVHAASLPIASRPTWAPPSVSSRTSVPAGTAISAPASRASRRAGSEISTATTRAPAAAAIITAAAVDGHPLTGPHAPNAQEGPVRGREPAAEERCRLGVDALWDRDEVHVRPVQRDELCERSPLREAWLRLLVADLMVPAGALRTAAARADEGNGYAISRPPVANPGSHGFHHAGELVARDVWEPADVRVVSHPAVPVAAAEPGRLHPHDRARRRGVRIGHGLDRRHPAERLVDHGTHALRLDRLPPCQTDAISRRACTRRSTSATG